MALQIANTFTVDTHADRVWEVLADEFVDVANWVSGLRGSSPNPRATEVPDGAPAGGRVCEVPGLGFTDERIIIFDPAQRRIGYSVDAEKIPSFVTGMHNVWTLTPDGPDRTTVRQELRADVHGVLGTLMTPLLRLQFSRLLSTIREDLRSYAETGTVSARKAAELAGDRS